MDEKEVVVVAALLVFPEGVTEEQARTRIGQAFAPLPEEERPKIERLGEFDLEFGHLVIYQP